MLPNYCCARGQQVLVLCLIRSAARSCCSYSYCGSCCCCLPQLLLLLAPTTLLPQNVTPQLAHGSEPGVASFGVASSVSCRRTSFETSLHEHVAVAPLAVCVCGVCIPTGVANCGNSVGTIVASYSRKQGTHTLVNTHTHTHTVTYWQTHTHCHTYTHSHKHTRAWPHAQMLENLINFLRTIKKINRETSKVNLCYFKNF